MRVRVFKKAQNRVESEDEFDFSQVKLGFWKCEDFASLENFEKCEWVFASLEEKNSLVCFLAPTHPAHPPPWSESSRRGRGFRPKLTKSWRKNFLGMKKARELELSGNDFLF